MHFIRQARSERRLHSGRVRAGVTWLSLMFLLGAVSAAAGGGYYYYSAKAYSQQTPTNLQTYVVKPGPFRYIVTQRGEVESSSNIEVRCEVQSRNTTGTAIIEIVPEGEVVKAGDIICRLDASAIKDEATQQQILCNTSEAAVIQAQNKLDTAKISRQEYLDGTFKQSEQVILGEISVAEENLRRAQDFVGHSEKLAVKGYVTTLQLEADRFSVEKERLVLETAQTKLNVLRNYTREKMLSTLDADIATSAANLRAQQSSHALDSEKLALIRAQISRCEIAAPADGQVVYANSDDDDAPVIEEGAMVRERQVLFRFPDPDKMQVRAKVDESRVAIVSDGMPATIRLDAFPERELQGTVKSVDAYPLGLSWRNPSSVKQYATFVHILEPLPGMRPGMTAEVKIKIQQIPEALQVPVQAVVEHNNQHYCLLPNATGLEVRQITLGSNNEKFVVVNDGLNPQDVVVTNPRAHLDRVALPEGLQPADTQANEIARANSAPTE